MKAAAVESPRDFPFKTLFQLDFGHLSGPSLGGGGGPVAERVSG
jgi:hypothetical protein